MPIRRKNPFGSPTTEDADQATCGEGFFFEMKDAATSLAQRNAWLGLLLASPGESHSLSWWPSRVDGTGKLTRSRNALSTKIAKRN